MLNESRVSSKIQSCPPSSSVHSKRATTIPLDRGESAPEGVCVCTLVLVLLPGSVSVAHLLVPGSIILSNKKDREKRQVNNRILNLCQWI